ncbi:MAG: N-acetylmuramic acid 6-phosphate etherase [Alphaproteobacteria bacterium]|nr:N-acetylmuramic acid 6-phosphate etherase [Alphaproteobacteria bacterium]
MKETEKKEVVYDNIENWETHKLLEELLQSQNKSFKAVKNALKDIEFAVSSSIKKLKQKNSKIVYVGAGTSGRIGAIDGVELIPTFGWPDDRVKFCFSGNNPLKPSEGSEDSEELAIQHFNEKKINQDDVVIGIAASGSTKYTLKIIELSKNNGALTIGVSNNRDSLLINLAEIKICLETGSEFLAGSTRLAAGTSQKIALNLFSTSLMIKLNRVYKGFMIDVIASNEKLKKRAQFILSEITGCSEEIAFNLLMQTNYNIRMSLMLFHNYTIEDAKKILEENDNNLHKILK